MMIFLPAHYFLTSYLENVSLPVIYPHHIYKTKEKGTLLPYLDQLKQYIQMCITNF